MSLKASATVYIISVSQYKYDKKIKLQEKADSDIQHLAMLTKSFLGNLKTNILSHINQGNLRQAYELENVINSKRRSIHNETRDRMQKGSDVRSELLFLDIVKYLEHIGDNSLNIMQALNQLTG